MNIENQSEDPTPTQNFVTRLEQVLSTRAPALRIAVIYGVFGVLWILFSDTLVELLTNDVGMLSMLQTYKGLGYIVFTTLGLYLLIISQTRLIRARQEIANKRARLQSTLARIGREALQKESLEAHHRYILMQVASYLEADIVKLALADSLDSGDEIAKALCWQNGEFSEVNIPVGNEYLSGYVMEQRHAVTIESYGRNQPFKVPQILLDEGVVSSLVAPILNESPLGVLGVHYTRPRKFDQSEDDFLQSIANMLAQTMFRFQAQENMQFQSQLLDSVGQAVIATDPQGNIFYWNPAAEAMYGWSNVEAIGRNVVELTPALGQDERAASIMAQMRAGISWEGEFRLRRKDGTEFFALVRNTILRDEGGETQAFIGITTDVTKIKTAQIALQQASDRLRLLHQIDQQILAGETVQQISQGVLESLFDQIPSEYSVVLEYDLTRQRARAISHIGGPSRFREAKWFPMEEVVKQAGSDMGSERHIYTPDLHRTDEISDVSQELMDLNQRSILVARLVADSQAVGAVGLSRSEPNAFNPNEIELLNSVADSLAIGLNQAKLREQEQKRAQELEQLHRFSLKLVSKLDLDELLSEVTRIAFELLDADDTYLYLLSTENGELRYAAGRTNDLRPRKGTRNVRPNGITNTVAKSGQREVVESVVKHPMLGDHFPDWKGALLSEPIQFHGETLGVLNIGFNRARQFSEMDLMITRLLGDMVATAIYNARQFQDIQRRQLELNALFWVTQRLSGQYKLSDVLEAIVFSVSEVIDGAEAASLWLSHGDTQVLKPEAWFGHHDQTMAELQFTHDQSAVGKIFSEKLPLDIEDTQNSEEFKPSGQAEVDRIRSMIGVPIWVGQEVIGALTADNFSHSRAFSQRDFRMLQLLANQAATAIQRAKLFSQVQNSRKRLEDLSRQLVRVQEEERRNLARELHDEIGQLLTGLKLSLEMTSDQLVDGEKPNLSEPVKIADDLLAEVRNLSLQLRPSMLDDFGLLPTLIWQVERSEQQLGLEIHFSHQDIEDRRFSSDIENTAYRVAQESLTNIARHAQVHEAWLNVWLEKGTIKVQIIDEGVGMDLAEISEMKSVSGLSGMKERARLIGGELFLDSAPGDGVTVTLELPISGTLERRQSSREGKQ